MERRIPRVRVTTNAVCTTHPASPSRGGGSPRQRRDGEVLARNCTCEVRRALSLGMTPQSRPAAVPAPLKGEPSGWAPVPPFGARCYARRKGSGWSVAFMRTVGGNLTSPALLAPGVGRKTLPARRYRKHEMFAAACIRHHPPAGVTRKRGSRPPLAREAAAQAAIQPAMRGQFPNAFQGSFPSALARRPPQYHPKRGTAYV